MTTSGASASCCARSRSWLTVRRGDAAATTAGNGAGLGERGTGKFDPPPIPTDVDEAVKEACDVSSPTIDRIRKDGVLFWAIGVSPPFGFEVERGLWAGVEAQNAAELANILGVDFDIAEYSYDTLPRGARHGPGGHRRRGAVRDRRPQGADRLLDALLPVGPALLRPRGLAVPDDRRPEQARRPLHLRNRNRPARAGRRSTFRRRGSATRRWATGSCSTTSSPPTAPTRRCPKRRQ